MRACIAAASGAALVALLAGPTAAQPAKLTRCSVGQRVLMPGGYPGVVTKIYGEGGCTVKDDAKGLESSWAAWMLTTPPGAPPLKTIPVSKLPTPGAYQCFGGAAGNMKLTFGPGNSYANEQGRRGAYIFRASGQMEFTSGPWKGFFAKTLEPTKVGLTSKPDGTFYQMTCDRR